MSIIPIRNGDRSAAAVEVALLSLQSKSIEALTQSVLARHLVTQQMNRYLARLKLDVNQLPVIHIAGTKGKGSTSAFTEQICRSHGLRTGLYTSPHLIRINERFRIDGQPISDEIFHKHFWAVWDGLHSTIAQAGSDPPIPSYFRFLTLVAFHLFTHHSPRLDVIVLEVGLGGKLDATNIIAAPFVCGITSIGYDHMEILGHTLREIAGEKAGIIKPHVPVYSVDSQSEEVKKTFEEVAASEGAPLKYVKPLSTDMELGLAGAHQFENASLACALAWEFLRKFANTYPNDLRTAQYSIATTLQTDSLPCTFLDALRSTSWPGRCQMLLHPQPEFRDRIQFYIDGAHTDASMRIAADWFQVMYKKELDEKSDRTTVLLFNCAHLRDPIELLIPLVEAAYPLSAAYSSTVKAGPPLKFSHIICTPFDHDRPHFSSAPTFHQLLQKYALTALGAGEPKGEGGSNATSRDMHPVIRRFVEQHFGFPVVGCNGSKARDEEELRTQTRASVQRVAERYAAPKISTMPASSYSTEKESSGPTPLQEVQPFAWQHTLFQVWQFLSEAFSVTQQLSEHKEECTLPASDNKSHHLCTFAPTVKAALRGIEQLANQQKESSVSVFVAGSLYLVGNVLQHLDYRV